MTSSLLGSWIDIEAATSAARELCPPEFLPAEEGSLPLSLAPMVLGDFQLAEDYKVDRYPVSHPRPPAPAMRARLTEIRNRAARAGLLGQGSEPHASDASAETIEPVLSPLGPAPVEAPDAQPSVLPALPESHQGCGASEEIEARPFVPPLGPLNLRARALADWIRENFSPTSLFVSDAQGRPLVEFDVSPDLIAGAIVLADAGLKARRHLPAADAGVGGAIYADIGPGLTLSLLSSHTALGLFHVGLIGPTALASSSARTISRSLRKTIEAQ
ncbi:MAG: hypothetical protein ACR2OZ_01635 [Verrucomicrobiales bacterium]